MHLKLFLSLSLLMLKWLAKGESSEEEESPELDREPLMQRFAEPPGPISTLDVRAVFFIDIREGDLIFNLAPGTLDTYAEFIGVKGGKNRRRSRQERRERRQRRKEERRRMQLARGQSNATQVRRQENELPDEIHLEEVKGENGGLRIPPKVWAPYNPEQGRKKQSSSTGETGRVRAEPVSRDEYNAQHRRVHHPPSTPDNKAKQPSSSSSSVRTNMQGSDIIGMAQSSSTRQITVYNPVSDGRNPYQVSAGVAPWGAYKKDENVADHDETTVSTRGSPESLEQDLMNKEAAIYRCRQLMANSRILDNGTQEVAIEMPRLTGKPKPVEFMSDMRRRRQTDQDLQGDFRAYMILTETGVDPLTIARAVLHGVTCELTNKVLEGFIVGMCNVTNHRHSIRSRSRRDTETHDLSFLKEKNWVEQKKCNEDEFVGVIDKTKVCKRWYDWTFSKDGNKLCTYGRACEEGSFIHGDDCKALSDDTEVATFCSGSIFHISTIIKSPSPRILEPEDPQLCSIGVHVVRECQNSSRPLARRLISYVKYNDELFLVTKHHNFRHVPDPKDIRNYVCTGCSGSKCLSCNGDAEYLAIWPDHNDTCHCSKGINQPFGTLIMVVDEEEYLVDYRFSKRMSVVEEQHEKKKLKKFCEKCQVKCDGNVLTVSENPNVKWVKTCVAGMCEIYKPSSAYPIPVGLLILNKKGIIHVADADSPQVLTTEFSCEMENTCDMIKCKLCVINLINPQCYVIVDYALVISILIVILIAVTLILRSLQLLTILISLIATLMKLLYRFFRLISRLTCVLTGKGKKRASKWVNSLELDEDILLENTPVAYTYPKKKEQKIIRTTNASKKYPWLVIIMITFSLISLVTSCTETVSYQFQEKDCQIKNDVEVCETKTKIQLTLGSMNTDSCLALKNKDRIVGHLSVKLKEMRTKCTEEFLYSVFEPEPWDAQNCHCWGSGLCYEADCRPSSLTTDQNLDLHFKEKHVVGAKGCKSISSDLFSECVGFGGCCLFKAGYRPNEKYPIHDVSYCSSTYFEAVFDVTISSGPGPIISQELILIAGQSKSLAQVKFIFTNPSVPWNPSYSLCIVRSREDKSNVHLAPCNKDGEMIGGRIGDIKCSRSSDLRNSTLGCTLAPNLVTPEGASTRVSFRFTATSIKNSIKYHKVPLVTPEFSSVLSGSEIWFSKSFSETLILHVSQPKVQIQAFSKQPACTLEFNSIDGCYNCKEGASMSVTSLCDFYPSMGSITCSYFKHPIPLLIQKGGKQEVRFSASSPYGNDNCSWTLGQKNGHFITKGHLLLLSHYESNLLDITIDGSTNSTSGRLNWTWVKDVGTLLSSLFSFTNWFWYVGALIIIVPSILIMLKFSNFSFKRGKNGRVKKF